MQKIIIAALLCTAAFAVASTTAAPGHVSIGLADGFIVTNGVSQVCHRSCKTCTGLLATQCKTCIGDATVTVQSDGSCGCTSGTHHLSATTGVLICELTAANTATVALCNSVPGMWCEASTTPKTCEWCNDNCKTCSTTAILCTATTGCWGQLANAATAGGAACTYVAAQNNTFCALEANNSGSATISAVYGYYHDDTNKKYMPCAVGCLTCTAAVVCSTCATGFAAVGTTNLTCECPAAGFFATAATAVVGTTVSLGACTACGTGCTTCSSATVCTVCDSSHMLGATTASSSTCETSVASSVAASSATATTDGESSMTSTTGTDAATTNGVLITAASVLLAVILA